MAHINNHAKRFRMGLSSASPFTAGGLMHCIPCRQEVDTNTEAHHEGTTYAYKVSCLRCGNVIQHGIYHNVPLLSTIPLPAGTVEWTTKPGPDRR